MVVNIHRAARTRYKEKEWRDVLKLGLWIGGKWMDSRTWPKPSQMDGERLWKTSRLPCYVFCICLSTNKYQKYKSVELGDQLIIVEMRGDVTDAGRRQTITEDRATQPMEAGGWVLQSGREKRAHSKLKKYSFLSKQVKRNYMCMKSAQTHLMYISHVWNGPHY